MPAKNSKSEDTSSTGSPGEAAAGAEPTAQAAAQDQQRQVQIRMDDREIRMTYANGFRTSTTAEEVILDFGLNLPVLLGQQSDKQETLLKLDTRVIMNYYSAKRLAMMLTQTIRRHEEEFGQLELDVSRRRVGT